MERMVCQAVAACFGTIAFSIFFRVPANVPTCGGIECKWPDCVSGDF